jgi:hypothetical protein
MWAQTTAGFHASRVDPARNSCFAGTGPGFHPALILHELANVSEVHHVLGLDCA